MPGGPGPLSCPARVSRSEPIRSKNMGKLFGTDGIRGKAGTFLSAELAQDLGQAASQVLAGPNGGLFVIARDTRESGGMLEAALAKGILSAGSDVLSAAILPTPGVAFLCRHLGACAGAVISASHNPATDNGIKFFSGEGFKLTDDQEASIEALLGTALTHQRKRTPRELPDAADLYVDHALAALEDVSLKGLRLVLDCSNGAAYRTSPEAFRRAGADLVVLHAAPDGLNINDRCGSQHLEGLIERVVEEGAHLGLAHDGDADRVIAVDEQGNVVDGDCIIAALAIALKEEGKLLKDLVVSTVMANLGFRLAMAREGIELVETPVGDRYVLEAMRTSGAVMGGEQSGHIIFSEFGTTGDGLVTGLRLARRMATTGQKLSELAAVVEKFPQILLNVRVENPGRFDSSEVLGNAVSQAQERLGASGRVLVRPSGTEPLVRVMVEAKDAAEAEAVAASLAQQVQRELVP